MIEQHTVQDVSAGPARAVLDRFSRRTADALRSAAIDRWETLQRSAPGELLRIRGFGPPGLAEVREELAAHGLRLRGDC